MSRFLGIIGCLLPMLGGSCSKVPLVPVNAGFEIADATWFEEEQTLFVFTELTAEQGLGDHSVIEIRYTTDDGEVDWTPLFELATVHTHLPVDCGPNALCGSASLHVPIEPRGVDLRMRYHRDGELSLNAKTAYNFVSSGPDHKNRSLIVYGVFDEDNLRIQWRGRHQFPTVRNKKAEKLGLRRDIIITNQRYGANMTVPGNNPYAYGATCAPTFVETGFSVVEFNERAHFNGSDLPDNASDDPLVCADATVIDALGTYNTTAVARKNPQVRPAFPVLRSPVLDATVLKFFLGPCDRVISEDFEEMQRQRLQMESTPTTCTEGWQNPGFVEDLVSDFRDAIEAERVNGLDMVLTVGLHQDEVGLSEVIEEAIAQVVPAERLQVTPRVAGAFVLDSTAYALDLPENTPSVLWCPAVIDLKNPYNPSAIACGIVPDVPGFDLGPLSFTTLPILPTRTQYEEFLETYSKAQAGSVNELTFRVPEFAATADHVGLDVFGAATFLNNETIGADALDAFSICVEDEPTAFYVFSSEAMQTGAIDFYECLYYLGLSEDQCALAQFGIAPLELLPDWHNLVGETSYDLGLLWEFPYLLRVEYQASVAGAVSAFGLSVPFGLNSSAESFYGAPLWLDDEFYLDELLTQCDRFCDHPTFNSAGVFEPRAGFRESYAQACYVPDFPEVGDGGFPLDP